MSSLVRLALSSSNFPEVLADILGSMPLVSEVRDCLLVHMSSNKNNGCMHSIFVLKLHRSQELDPLFQSNDASTASGLLSTAQSYPSLTNEAITAAAISQSELSSDSDQDLVDLATGGGMSSVRALEVMIDADEDSKQSDLDNDDDYEDVMVRAVRYF